MSIESIVANSAVANPAVAAVPGRDTGSGTAKVSDPASNTLDKQAFLELLVTQLRNQDPSSPMDSNALMAQTTQMASMESLTEISTTSRESFALQMRAAAAALVGQNVSYSNGTDTITGQVTAISYAGTVPTVTVAGKDVPLDTITTITAAGIVPAAPGAPAASA